ncbi:putative 2,5-didehydrogluconate reductase [Paenibacillus agaridevorans]|uniref:Putative 2,5-didehydrogluconate reductase n=1 Tax=Paenibacillus agaridevorans TaxID=171404 RepID=A0A2R5ELC6_9BACL|nr:putative 2,5-didehydrogluconate reductase [Paenibacillus agaridevorans]
MVSIASLDTKQSVFFSHRDPEWVKWLGTRKLEINSSEIQLQEKAVPCAAS